jgi:hypothetical protein
VGVVWCILEAEALDVGVDGQQRICRGHWSPTHVWHV